MFSDLLAIFEEDEVGDAGDVEFFGEFRRVVGIDFDDRETIDGTELLQNAGLHFAGAAPIGVEVDEDEPGVGTDFAREVTVTDVRERVGRGGLCDRNAVFDSNFVFATDGKCDPAEGKDEKRFAHDGLVRVERL